MFGSRNSGPERGRTIKVMLAVTSVLILVLVSLGYYALVGAVLHFGVILGLVLAVTFLDVLILLLVDVGGRGED